VIDEIRVGRRQLWVIEQLGSPDRPVLRVFEGGPVGQMRCLHLLPNSREGFRRLRLLNKLSSAHSNLPFIVDVIRTDGRLAVITKWIDGPSLAEYLANCRSGKEPWPSPYIVINLVRGLARGLRLLHERMGVVNGDLHPGYLFLCRHTKRLIPIDFGSAWMVEVTRHRWPGDGVALAYAAPELLGGEGQPGFRSDQYSVMTICYEMLTGKIPYDGLGGRAIMLEETNRLRVQCKPASHQLKNDGTMPASVSHLLDEVMSRGVALNPQDRYASPRLWLEGLDEIANQMAARDTIGPANRWLLTQLERLEGLWQSKSKL
jgi:serine/threonine protein kinase